MSASQKSLKELFLAALDVAPENRAEWLERECAGDTSLRQHLILMLEAHDAPQSLLDRPAAPLALRLGPGSATVEQPMTERPGMFIGPYKLLEQIGEGGMGVVYMAEQYEPVKRRVALKIIKPGMDTRQVIARFEAERQALSLMDHPNIATVLDAGTTDSGRPYFVMELVKGQPITQYCDEHHLTPRERLELLLPVFLAIQHAHQKGIIHRDIKPTNILVAEYDHQPALKVIDFGVAKATGQTLTEKTMFTGLGQIVGTLEYMSPEQAKVNQLDIDTRSDIYSLGVLLYELLTGSTPFDKKRLRSAAFEEMLRIIREEEPPKPSTKLSSSETMPSVAANRSMEPNRLSASSALRTADQTDACHFAAASTSTYLWNRAAIDLLAKHGGDDGDEDSDKLLENARLLARLNLAIADAVIACWDAKYFYEYWRPVTAIRLEDADGDGTPDDPNWTPLVVTPPFPEYTSGHSSIGGAAATILANHFGDDTPFMLQSQTDSTWVRFYPSFSAAVEEIADARVFAGIHFRTACDEGAAMGSYVATYILANQMQPLRGDDE